MNHKTHLTLIHSTQLTEKMIELVRINLLDILLDETILDAKSWQGTLSDSKDLYRKWIQPLKPVLESYGIDILLHSSEYFNPKLIVFDMDSTLINEEVINELAQEANTLAAVKQITEKAMLGQLDFKTSLIQRLQQLQDLPITALDHALSRIKLNSGASLLFKTLKENNCKTAILSGGFTWFAEKLQDELDIDHVIANQLEIKDNRLTGHLIGPLIDGEAKRQKLIELATYYKIELQKTIAIGDGANDIPMLNTAGMGIAFHAKPMVQNSTKHRLNHTNLDALIYLFTHQ